MRVLVALLCSASARFLRNVPTKLSLVQLHDPREQILVPFDLKGKHAESDSAKCDEVGKVEETMQDKNAMLSEIQSLVDASKPGESSASTRFAVSSGNVKAREHIIKQMNAFGLDTTVQDDFDIRLDQLTEDLREVMKLLPSLTTSNIIGVKKATGPLSNEYVVLGAHYDSINWPALRKAADKLQQEGTGGSALEDSSVRESRVRAALEATQASAPGADDNASGVAALLRTASALKGLELKRSVVFVCFSGEEEGLLGSKHFVNDRVAADKLKLTQNVGTIIMDQVGFDKTKHDQAILETKGDTPGNNRVIDALALSGCDHGTPKGFALKAFSTGLSKNYHGFDSDHIPFLDAKIPTALLIERANEDYDDIAVHSENDVIANVDPQFAANMATTAALGVYTLANA